MDDRTVRREALLEAQSAYDRGECPVGAVPVQEGRIVARAGNRESELHDPTAHAEVLVLRVKPRNRSAPQQPQLATNSPFSIWINLDRQPIGIDQSHGRRFESGSRSNRTKVYETNELAVGSKLARLPH